MADNSNNWMTQKQKEYEGQNKPYTPPYKWNTLAWDIGNLASNFLNQEKQGYKEFWDYIQRSKDATSAWANWINNYVVDNWNESRRQIWEDAKYIFWNPEANNTASLKSIQTPNVIHVDNPWTVSVSSWEKPTWPVAFDKQWALDYANSVREKLWQNDATQWATQWTSQWNAQWTKSAWWTWTTQNVNPYDKMASDLLNQWLTSTEDVVYYLAANVPWWNNLNEMDRVNMVNDILGRMSNQTNGEQAQPETPSNALPSDYSNSVVQGMQNDFQASENDKIYGKVWAWQSEWIVANVDANSIYASAEQSRIAKVQSVLTMDPSDFAYSLGWWDNAVSEQTIADLKRYAPEYWSQVQAQLNSMRVEDTVNAIASWDSMPDTWKASIDSVNSWVNSWAMSNSETPQQTQYTIQNISNAMSNNQIATNATQLIANIDAEIEEYNSKLNNLRKEANNAFKWDVPDYIVNAYINNRSQKYQAEIEKLEWRRQSALDMYKIELWHYEWGQEMWLKYQQFQRDLNNDTWDRWYKEQQLNKANIHWENWKAYQVNSDWTITQLSDATALYSYQADVQDTINWYKSLYTSWWGTKTATGYKYGVCGLECEWFTDNFTEATTGLRMTWEGGRTWTTAQEKMDYCNTWTPVVWSIAVWVWWVYDSTYWHTMIVTWWDPNTQMVELLWSNKDWDKTVYTTTDTLSNLYNKGLYGFWDPYKDMVAQNAGYSVGYDANWNYITPMTATFDDLISNATTAWQMEDIGRAEQWYDFLYEITHDNGLYNSWESSLDVFVDSWDLAKVLNYLSKENFEKSSSDEWNTFMSTLNDYKNRYMAKEFAWWVQSEKALSYLIQLVELKLRKESWAVINSWEWATNFNNLLPMPWESSERQYDKMKAWDSIILRQLRAWWFDKKSDYIPIFSESMVREIW